MILAGDVGGTKVNLALFDGNLPIKQSRFESRNFSGIEEVLDVFLKNNDSKIDKACFGVAGQVVDDTCKLTNISWQIEAENIKKNLKLDAVWLINDLVAMAYGITLLDPESFEVLQKGDPVNNSMIAVVSAGTGLVQAFLIPGQNGKHTVLGSEGGHCDFSPRNELEAELLFFLQKKYSRVSIERVLSGPGIMDIYSFLKTKHAEQETIDFPAGIVDKAIKKNSRVCEHTLELFVSLYGALSGNLALQYLSEGGVFLGGGISPKLIPLLHEGGFMEAFLSKGRFKEYLSKIPVKVVMDESTPLRGAAHYARVK